jgi:hypothetical protein
MKYEGKSKSKGTLQKKRIYFKCTETKLISFFNVILFDFKAPVPEFRKFFLIPSKKTFLIASLTSFPPRQIFRVDRHHR